MYVELDGAVEARVAATGEAFERLSTVSDVVSVLRAIPAQQTEKIAIIRGLAPAVAPVPRSCRRRCSTRSIRTSVPAT